VVAVEPVAGMRAAIGPGVVALEGTAERLPLADAEADAVTVAQAFHWFDGPAALAEIHRVLRPGGSLALVWNVRRLEDAEQAALERILAQHRGDVPAHRAGRWRDAFESSGLFGPLEERRFENEQRLDADGLWDRVASTSFIAALPQTEFRHVESQVRALAAGEVRLRYLTEIQVCDRRSGGE
jgi:SAM-dependent methyltransferase